MKFPHRELSLFAFSLCFIGSSFFLIKQCEAIVVKETTLSNYYNHYHIIIVIKVYLLYQTYYFIILPFLVQFFWKLHFTHAPIRREELMGKNVPVLWMYSEKSLILNVIFSCNNFRNVSELHSLWKALLIYNGSFQP